MSSSNTACFCLLPRLAKLAYNFLVKDILPHAVQLVNNKLLSTSTHSPICILQIIVNSYTQPNSHFTCYRLLLYILHTAQLAYNPLVTSS